MRRGAVLAVMIAAGCATTPPFAPSAQPVPAPAGAAIPTAAPPAAAALAPKPEVPAPLPLPPGEPVALPPPPDLRIFLASSRAPLRSQDMKGLAALADRLGERPRASVAVESYSTWHGSREFNMALAQQRADDVKEALMKLGVPRGRIRTTAYGEERRNDSPAEQSRIDIRVTEAGG